MSRQKHNSLRDHSAYWANFAGFGIIPQKPPYFPKGISWEEFENTFRLAFGREMTLDERRWFELSRLIEDDSEQRGEASSGLKSKLSGWPANPKVAQPTIFANKRKSTR